MNSRRTFIRQTALAGGAAISAPLENLWRAANANGAHIADNYGPLFPAADETTGLRLIELPKDFRYLSFGWFGDAMANGRPTPRAHDGMAAFALDAGRIALVRNHEISQSVTFDKALAYDEQAGGGTTTMIFDANAGRLVESRPSLAGTLLNCAGGPTPWGSWLTCEETTLGIGDHPLLTKNHGYVFEVPLHGQPSREPLTAMGRFVHEAVAIDPSSGIVYQTEDRRRAGLYRFIPRTKGKLAEGGRLQMMAIAGKPKFDTRVSHTSGGRYAIHWVDIDNVERPHADPAQKDSAGVFTQGLNRGAAIFARLEGAWYSGGCVFVTATEGGDARMGQVWELNIANDELRLVFESPGAHVLNMPDNIAVSPKGGLVLCEDGTANPCLHVLSRDGSISRFARNTVVLNGQRNGLIGDFTGGEFAGATFSPDGRWLFVNIQSPGITFAITGPWERGIL
jgi:hypothetical protein